ncbi:hypothetical protein [Rhodococcus globerulus]|uniref:Integral membrane protein n=1 Tax=Rhodococcus globerulus TaxID=33008 RepID=A0ABU4C529_RHOGO|nr:hypothetical protein [Rhodococcus globerulus]MDV6271610.1 hypothetical protein [Rhodococcus globerulus]
MEPTPRRTRTDGTGESSSGTPRRPDSAASSGRASARATTATTTARKHPIGAVDRASAHPRSTEPNRTRRPDSSAKDTERGGSADTIRSRVFRSVEAVVEWLKTRIHRLLEAARDRGAMLTEKIQQKIQEWIDTLIDEVAHGGVGMQAGLEGVRAALTGKNPVWAAIKGLVSGLSGKAKVALILLLVLGLLLGPVLLVVLLLALLVMAIVAAVRAATD